MASTFTVPVFPRGPSSDELAVSDEAVVASVLGGDVATFETLMRRYNRRVFRAARAVLHHDQDAEDAAQRAWLNAFRALAQWDRARGSFSTWLVRIAVNEARTIARGRRAGHDEEEGLPTDALEADPELALTRGEVRAILEAALDTIDPGQRIVIVLRDVEGLNSPEVAEALGLSEEAVRVRLHRGRKALRARMEAALGLTAPEIFPFDGARCDRLVRGVLDALGVARA